ncbi:MAG: 1-deoxy-D-xylulose-5-phosphate synthase [Candidatus Woesearchaeota archaeon]
MDNIRQQIIDSVQKNGGHLASNLGTIELAIALHTAFKTPEDKIIWDVGHQSYAHKILTGRSLETLRQVGGTSPFPNIRESEHDAFGTGHSSTSVSAALGMACARDLSGESYDVIAVIGDGALTGGMAFEGLNHAGYLQKDMIIILNDNKMSIALNTGALAKYSNRISKTRHYDEVKKTINHLLENYDLSELKDLKTKLKLLTTPVFVFEKLGLNYLGPIDGHDTDELISTFRKAKVMKGPKLIHVMTKKGKGYPAAEENATKYHGLPPLNGKTSKQTYTSVFSNHICKLAEKDSRIVAVTAAMPDGTGLNEFACRFPARFFDVGIAEQHAVTFAAGLAKQGYKPIVAIYSTFLQRAYDQVIHDVCLQNLPVTFAIDRAGLVGEDGATHHGQFDLSYLRCIPNLVISAPGSLAELPALLDTALDHDGPFAIRYPRGSGMKGESSTIETGTSTTFRKGKDLLLIAIGSMVQECLKAADILESQGIEATVINARFLKPIDHHIINEIQSHDTHIIAEENSIKGGLYSEIQEQLGHGSISLPDSFIEHGSCKELRSIAGITAKEIAEKANLYINNLSRPI